MIQLEKGNRYLCEDVNFSSYHYILEFLCLEVTKTSYKIKNLITDSIFWCKKELFENNSNWGKEGYFIYEQLGKYRKGVK